MAYPPSSSVYALRVPPSARKCGTGLFDQQMWCLGRDIVHPQGNCLIAWGLSKSASPEPRFRSFYSQMLAGGQIRLWGWGIQLAMISKGSLFLARGRFHPLYSPNERLADVWCVNHMPPMHMPNDQGAAYAYRELWVKLLCWLADYETWLQTYRTSSYRSAVIQAWPNRKYKPVPAGDMPYMWRNLARIIETAPIIGRGFNIN